MFQNFRRLPRFLEDFVEKRPLLSVLIVIAYVVSPIDVLPEGLIGPLGYFDDALVTIAAVALLKRAAKTRLAKRAALVAAAPAAPALPAATENRRPPERSTSHGDPRNQGPRDPRDGGRGGDNRGNERRGWRRRRGRRRHGGQQRPPA